jgi:hypothetical protein
LKHSSTLLSPGYVVADDRPARARHLLQNSVATTSYRLGKERNTCMQCHILVVDFILNFSVNFVSYYHRIKIYAHNKFTAQNHAIDFYDWAKKGIRIKLKIDYIYVRLMMLLIKHKLRHDMIEQ